MLTNAHLHLKDRYVPEDFSNQRICLSAGSPHELSRALDFKAGMAPSGCLISCGIHPWRPEPDELEWVEHLLDSGCEPVDAIGECGLDLCTPERKASLTMQRLVLEKQLEAAARHGKPVVFHAGRCIQYIFEYAPRLKKVPSVIFHGFPGTSTEALSILRHGINAYFSFGHLLAAGAARTVECVSCIPLERILLETDDETPPALLLRIYDAAAGLKQKPRQEFEDAVSANFSRAYDL